MDSLDLKTVPQWKEHRKNTKFIQKDAEDIFRRYDRLNSGIWDKLDIANFIRSNDAVQKYNDINAAGVRDVDNYLRNPQEHLDSQSEDEVDEFIDYLWEHLVTHEYNGIDFGVFVASFCKDIDCFKGFFYKDEREEDEMRIGELGKEYNPKKKTISPPTINPLDLRHRVSDHVKLSIQTFLLHLIDHQIIKKETIIGRKPKVSIDSLKTIADYPSTSEAFCGRNLDPIFDLQHFGGGPGSGEIHMESRLPSLKELYGHLRSDIQESQQNSVHANNPMLEIPGRHSNAVELSFDNRVLAVHSHDNVDMRCGVVGGEAEREACLPVIESVHVAMEPMWYMSNPMCAATAAPSTPTDLPDAPSDPTSASPMWYMSNPMCAATAAPSTPTDLPDAPSEPTSASPPDGESSMMPSFVARGWFSRVLTVVSQLRLPKIGEERIHQSLKLDDSVNIQSAVKRSHLHLPSQGLETHPRLETTYRSVDMDSDEDLSDDGPPTASPPASPGMTPC